MNPDNCYANINFDADKSPSGCASDHFVAYPDHFCEYIQIICVNINITIRSALFGCKTSFFPEHFNGSVLSNRNKKRLFQLN
jgi:hypothetical protein